MSEKHLLNVPIDIFHYYVKLYNRHQKDREFDEFQRQSSGAKNNKPMPVGDNMPRKQ